MMDIKPVVCLLAVFAVAVCTVEAEEVPRLNDLPKVNRLWLGMEEGFIRPASYEQVMSESQTRLSIHAEHGSKIVKGQHWELSIPFIWLWKSVPMKLSRFGPSRI